MASRPYDGQAGRTAWAETTVWCGGCGAWFGGRVLRTLDGDADAELLSAFVRGGFAEINSTDCPGCDWQYTAEEALTVHLPSRAKLFLVIPESGRHRAQEARARVISSVAGNPGQFVPAYALEPALIAGSEQLSEFVEEVERGRSPQRSSATVDDTPSESEVIFVQAPKLDEADFEPITDRPRQPTGRLSGLLAAVLGEEEGEESSTDGTPSGESWSLASVADSPSDDEKTNVVHRDEITRPQMPSSSVDGGSLGVEDDSLAGPDGSVPDQSSISLTDLGDSTEALRTTGQWIEYDDQQVRLVWAATEAESQWFETAHVELRFQQFSTPHGRAWVLGLFEHLVGGGLRDVVAWGLEVGNSSHDAVVGALAERFDVEIACAGADGKFNVRRTLKPPLEENVARALDRASERGDAQALTHILASGFDRCGKPQHNFRENSFLEFSNAGEVRLSLGIVGYWSLDNLTDHLLDVLSFPAVWFDAMVMRILQAAIEKGLAFEPHLRAIAVAEGLVRDEPELLARLVDNFGEHMLLPDNSGLELLEQWENWERLLTWADVMGIEIPTNRQSQALAALEAAHASEAAAMGGGLVVDESIELSIRDAIVVESMNSTVGLLSEPGQTEWEELSDASLIELLQGDSAQPVYELLRRNDQLYAPTIFEAVWRLPAQALAVALPMLVEQGETYGELLREALQSDWPTNVLAAVVLAEIGDAQAAGPLLKLLAERDDTFGDVLAEGAARLGRAIIEPALAPESLSDVPDERVVSILFMAGKDALEGLEMSGEAAKLISRAKAKIEADGPHVMDSFSQWVPSVVGAVSP